MKIIVTAGPTREQIDNVRFISNLSSGRMGYEIARIAGESGHDVILVSGPSTIEPPLGVDFVPVTSAAGMAEAVKSRFNDCDAVVMAAAVADYRPKEKFEGKLHKSEGPMTLELERTEDILKTLGEEKKNRILVGFALQASEDDIQAGIEKCRAKNADLVVANTVSAMGRAIATVFIADSKEIIETLKKADKEQIARAVIARIENLSESRK
ncbi:MAG: phosphopantothenoylcysteine decarboxylase domain-containing protein [Planctomycetota bacterium]|jgi:phosphopantothenoylcysteine decarboxylase/phosphopantothenate--cysteine ligase